MRMLMFGACASLLACAALAQPYDQDQPPYPNANQGYGGQPYPNDNDQYRDDQTGGYQYDSRDQDDQYRDDRRDSHQEPGGAYDRNSGYQDRYQDERGYSGDPEYRGDRSYGDSRSYYAGGAYGVPAGAHYSGRVGQSWRDPDGRYCAYRELTWMGANGTPAYKWVPRCHY